MIFLRQSKRREIDFWIVRSLNCTPNPLDTLRLLNILDGISLGSIRLLATLGLSVACAVSIALKSCENMSNVAQDGENAHLLLLGGGNRRIIQCQCQSKVGHFVHQADKVLSNIR
jgi:hypothetical protein